MLQGRRPWREELEIIDRTMRSISGITDPEELVSVYWQGIGELLPIQAYVAFSRRGVPPPDYLITRSSRFVEHPNPWTERERLPRLRGGLLGEILAEGRPAVIEDLPARLRAGDPAWFYLEGFQTLVALPQYDGGEALNYTCMLLPPGFEIDRSVIPVLHWQSGLFGRGTQNMVLRNQLQDLLTRLDRELQTVGEIQRSLLPAEVPRIAGMEVAASYVTSQRAGGDYYDFFPLPDGRWGVFVADVSGHGTPAAVLMAITHALAHSRPGSHVPPSALLAHLNQTLCAAYTRDGTFVTAFYGVLDPAERTLRYALAGHHPPRLVRGGRVTELPSEGALPLGIIDGVEYGESVAHLHAGDVLLVYTDGITEAMAPPATSAEPPKAGPWRAGEREMFGTGRLDACLVGNHGASASACLAAIGKEVDRFCQGAEIADDRTMVAVRCV
jgi:phosphoserine phosphatase RsbU/P